MDCIPVRIRFEKDEKDDTLINKVKSIRLISDNINYLFPEELQDEIYHKELFSLNDVSNCCKSMKKKVYIEI